MLPIKQQTIEEYISSDQQLNELTVPLSTVWERVEYYLRATDCIIDAYLLNQSDDQQLMKTKEEKLSQARELITRIRNTWDCYTLS